MKASWAMGRSHKEANFSSDTESRHCQQKTRFVSTLVPGIETASLGPEVLQMGVSEISDWFQGESCKFPGRNPGR